MYSGTVDVPVVVDDEGTTVVLGVVECCGSSELSPDVPPTPTSADASEDSDRQRYIGEGTRGVLATLGVDSTVGDATTTSFR